MAFLWQNLGSQDAGNMRKCKKNSAKYLTHCYSRYVSRQHWALRIHIHSQAPSLPHPYTDPALCVYSIWLFLRFYKLKNVSNMFFLSSVSLSSKLLNQKGDCENSWSCSETIQQNFKFTFSNDMCAYHNITFLVLWIYSSPHLCFIIAHTLWTSWTTTTLVF